MRPERTLAPDLQPADVDQDRRTLTAVAASLSLCLLYAVVRYHVFGGVAWSHLPLYTFNKAVSFSAVIVLASAYVARDKALAKRLGLAAFGLVLLHFVMSMALLAPKNYPKLFTDDRLNLEGEISVLCGVLPLFIWTWLALLSIPAVAASLTPPHLSRRGALGYWALAVTAVHLAAMGWKGWIAPSTWHGGMPPITLLSLAAVALPLVHKAVSRRQVQDGRSLSTLRPTRRGATSLRRSTRPAPSSRA